MANGPKPMDVLLDPIFKRNPIALLVLGICSALAVTTKLSTSCVMAIAVIAVTGCSGAVNQYSTLMLTAPVDGQNDLQKHCAAHGDE